MGSFEFVLSYEPEVLEVTGVERGALAGNALLQSSTATPGSVWAGIIDANGISGNGPAAVVTFTVVGNSDSNTLFELDDVAAYDATTLLDIITQASPGSFVAKDGSISPPSLGFLR